MSKPAERPTSTLNRTPCLKHSSEKQKFYCLSKGVFFAGDLAKASELGNHSKQFADDHYQSVSNMGI